MSLELKRELGFWHTWSICLGLVLCSTTLMMMGLGAGDLGAGFTWPQLITLALLILVALTFSELATMYPSARSLEEYTTEALGPLGGISVGLWYGFKDIFGLPAQSALAGLILEYFIPVAPWYVWAIAALTIFLIVNMLGIEMVGKVQLLLTAIAIATYIAIAVVGFSKADFPYLTQTLLHPPESIIYGTPAGLPSILVTSLMGVWLLVGMEVAAPLAEEIKNPRKVLPLAMVTSLIALFVIHELIVLSFASSVPREVLLAEFPPSHIGAAKYLLGLTGAIWLSIISFIETGSTVNTVLAGATRVLYGMSGVGYLPKTFGWLHPKYRTPWNSLLILYALMLVLILLSAAWLGVTAPFVLALTCCFVFMLVYLFIFINLMILRVKRPEVLRPFSIGGFKRFPILGLIGLIASLIITYFSVVPPFGDIRILYLGGIYSTICFIAALVIYSSRVKKTSKRVLSNNFCSS